MLFLLLVLAAAPSPPPIQEKDLYGHWNVDVSGKYDGCISIDRDGKWIWQHIIGTERGTWCFDRHEQILHLIKEDGYQELRLARTQYGLASNKYELTK